MVSFVDHSSFGFHICQLPMLEHGVEIIEWISVHTHFPVQVHLLSQPNEVENAVNSLKSASGELTQPSIREKTCSKAEHHHQDALSNIESARSSPR